MYDHWRYSSSLLWRVAAIWRFLFFENCLVGAFISFSLFVRYGTSIVISDYFFLPFSYFLNDVLYDSSHLTLMRRRVVVNMDLWEGGGVREDALIKGHKIIHEIKLYNTEQSILHSWWLFFEASERSSAQFGGRWRLYFEQRFDVLNQFYKILSKANHNLLRLNSKLYDVGTAYAIGAKYLHLWDTLSTTRGRILA